MGFRKFMANEADFQVRAQQRARDAKVIVKNNAPRPPGLLHQFTSHIEGRNAQVMIYVDRIEWDRPKRAFSKKDMGTEMIPVKSMSSVTTKRDGFINTKVSVITVGNTVDFRVSHDEAKLVKDVLTQLILGNHPAQQRNAPAVPSNSPSFTDRLATIQSLHQRGILTDAEYGSKRTAILSEM